MLLGAVHKAVGQQAPIEIKSKGRYQVRDIHRWVEYYGLPMEFPDPFPFRTLKTMRAAVALEGEGISNLSLARHSTSTGKKEARRRALRPPTRMGP
jgi:2-hydroxychromene-2-carboxylate isomerase